MPAEELLQSVATTPAESEVELIKAAESEVKLEMTRDALFSRARIKGSSAVGDLIDQI